MPGTTATENWDTFGATAIELRSTGASWPYCNRELRSTGTSLALLQQNPEANWDISALYYYDRKMRPTGTYLAPLCQKPEANRQISGSIMRGQLGHIWLYYERNLRPTGTYLALL
jgi:hypothetical protein